VPPNSLSETEIATIGSLEPPRDWEPLPLAIFRNRFRAWQTMMLGQDLRQVNTAATRLPSLCNALPWEPVSSQSARSSWPSPATALAVPLFIVGQHHDHLRAAVGYNGMVPSR
jgi:hypothetical protein